MSLSTSEQLNILMDVNQLSYSPAIDSSLSNSRQLKRYAFSPQDYNARQQPQIQLNSGGDFISGPTSYINLDIEVTATGEAKWNKVDDSNGSCFNIIREYQHSHKSGDVLDRTDQLNNLVAELVRYAHDSSYSEKFAQVFGYGNTDDLSVGGKKSYALPMFLFSGLFGQRALIPSFLMAGSKIKIQLETNVTALVAGNVDALYQVKNMNIVLDSIDLFDGAKRSLMLQAGNVKTQGLQYPYSSWFQLRKSESSQNLNFDLNLSAAKTIKLIVKTRLTSTLTAGAENSFVPEIYNYSNWRVRIGSQSMPQDLVQNSAYSYMITQEAFSGQPDSDILNRKDVKCGVSYNDYSTVDVDDTAAIVAISLEKNSIVALSGEITNNCRLLNFTAQYNTMESRVVDAYILHLRVANIMLDNVVVDR